MFLGPFVILLLDTIVLFCLIYFFLRESAPEFLDVTYVAIGISVASSVLVFFLAPVIGVLVVIPIAIIVCLVLMFFCTLPLRNAIIVTVLFVIYKIGTLYLGR